MTRRWTTGRTTGRTTEGVWEERVSWYSFPGLCNCTSQIFALFKSAVVGSHFLPLFSKVRLCDRNFCCSFQKCNCAIALFVLFLKVWLFDCTFLFLFKSVIVGSHFLSHFSKAQQKEWSLLKKCTKSANFQIALFTLFKKSNHTFSKCANAQPCPFLALKLGIEKWQKTFRNLMQKNSNFSKNLEMLFGT